jgi:hypothetical protein
MILLYNLNWLMNTFAQIGRVLGTDTRNQDLPLPSPYDFLNHGF